MQFGELTRILGVLGTNIVVTSVKNILVHQRSPRRDLSEEADLNRFTNLNPLSFLNENLPSILATILAIQRWNTILFWVVSLFERL